MGHPVTVFYKPNGQSEIREIQEMYPEDEQYLRYNNVKVSTEDIGFDSVVYFDDGHFVNNDPREDPDEIIVFMRGRTPKEVIKEAVQLLKDRKTKYGKK